MQIRMKQIVMKDGCSCPWDGPATRTLTEKHGTLTYDTEVRGVIAVHGGNRDPMLIPLESICYLIEHGAAAQKAEEDKAAESLAAAQERAAREAQAEAAHDPAAPQGIEKYVKDPITGAVELKRV